MARNIRVDVDHVIQDGTEIKFRSPVHCSGITGIVVYYPTITGARRSREFILSDAHGRDVGNIDHLFTGGVIVKVVLDVTQGVAFVQNADTNAYLEEQLQKRIKTINGVGPDANGNVNVSVSGSGVQVVAPSSGGVTAEQYLALEQVLKLCVFTSDPTQALADLRNAFYRPATAISVPDEVTLNATPNEMGNMTYTLQIEVVPADTTDTVVWTSSDDTVATVDSGVVTVQGQGVCEVTATAGNVSASCSVRVVLVYPSNN